MKWAFNQEEVKLILCAIGGDDTYRTVPYLLEDTTFREVVLKHPKIFMGYLDTNINHLMFQKLGLGTFYGPSAIVDFGELAQDMLDYTVQWTQYLFSDDVPKLISSTKWYYERTDFSPEAFGSNRESSQELHEYEVLFGNGKVNGNLYGGCLESLGELVLGDRYGDEVKINDTYQLLTKDNANKILFLETSEEKPTPEHVEKLLSALADYGFFNQAKGLLIGKPQDEVYYDAYKTIYQKLAEKYQLPTVYNVNFGHAHPRCILPIGQSIIIDLDNKQIDLSQPLTKVY